MDCRKFGTLYFLDQACILHMQNLFSAVIKDTVDVIQDILCDADVSLTVNKTVYLQSPLL